MSAALRPVPDLSQLRATLAERFPEALALRHRDQQMVAIGVPALDALTGGLPRGGLTEISGAPSSGRTSLLHVALAHMSKREACALVDATGAFNPSSAASAGTRLERLLWVRCDGPGHPRSNRRCDARWQHIERALKATDLLLESGGFGMVAVDLADLPGEMARRVPLASWFRFRRAVEDTPTVLLLLTLQPCARTCASLALTIKLDGSRQRSANEAPAHSRLLEGIAMEVELVRSRLARKPAGSVRLEARSEWAG